MACTGMGMRGHMVTPFDTSSCHGTRVGWGRVYGLRTSITYVRTAEGTQTGTSRRTNHTDLISPKSQHEKRGRSNQQQRRGSFLVLPRCQTPHGQENTFLVSTKEFSHSKETESENQEAAQISSGPEPHYASGSLS